MKLSKNIFLLLATGNSITNGMEKDHNSDNITMEHNPTDIFYSNDDHKNEEQEHNIEPNNITNVMENDLNLNNLPYDDNTSLTPISRYDKLFARYEELEYQYKTLQEDQKIMENYLERWITVLNIKADGIKTDGKTCLKNLKEIPPLSEKERLSQCQFSKEEELLQSQSSSEEESEKELDDEMDTLNLNEDPQHIKDLKKTLQIYKYIAKYEKKTLPIYKYIGKSNKYKQDMELQRITKLEMKIKMLTCKISNRKYKNYELVVKIYQLEAELPYLENMVKEKQWGLKQIKEYLINESMFTYN